MTRDVPGDRDLALVLDANARAGVAAIRALGRAGRNPVVAERTTYPEAIGFASRWAGEHHVLPDYADEPAAFLAELLRVLDRHPIGVVIPATDGTLTTLLQHRAEIESRGAVVAAGSSAAVERASDKAVTLQAARDIGVPVPRGMQVHDRRDVAEAARLVGFPLVVKPVKSWADTSGRVGRLLVSLATTMQQLHDATERLLDVGDHPIVQQWLPGRREAIHVFFADGRAWAQVGVTARRTAPPLGGNSVLRETIPLPADSARYAIDLLRQVDLEGYSEVEFRRDAAGVPVLMEINPRLSQSVEVAIRAGGDFPNYLYDRAMGVPFRPLRQYRVGVRLRWLGGDLRWLRDTVRSQGQPDIVTIRDGLTTFGADFLRPTSYDYLDREDIAPALAALRGIAGLTARRVAERLPRRRSR